MTAHRRSISLLAPLATLALAALLAGCGSSGAHKTLLDMANLDVNVAERLDQADASVVGATCVKTGETIATCALRYGASPSEEGQHSIEVNVSPNGQSWEETTP
jgi:hypothetical protein